ncbi:MAG: LptF/LptG family permease [bacterium]
MRILDRYLIRQFLVVSAFGLLTFILIFLIIDNTEKLDDFIDAKMPLETIIEYYLYFIPEIIKLMTPVALLLGALFVVGRMTNQNEISAIKSSGVSLYRVTLPFILVALVVSLASIYFSGWVVPKATQKRITIERVHMQQSGDLLNRYNIIFEESRTQLVSISHYNGQTKIAWRVSIQEFSDSNLTVLTRRLDAKQMEWSSTIDSTGKAMAGWTLVEGMKRELSGDRQTLSPFQKLWIGSLSITPDDIEKKQHKPEEMDYSELQEFIKNQKNAGQDVSRWMVDFHSRIAFPFASVVVVLFGVPFASIKRRSGVAIDFGICAAVTFIYLAFMKISNVFGYNGDIHPMATAWMANCIFLVLGVLNLIRIKK